MGEKFQRKHYQFLLVVLSYSVQSCTSLYTKWSGFSTASIFIIWANHLSVVPFSIIYHSYNIISSLKPI